MMLDKLFLVLVLLIIDVLESNNGYMPARSRVNTGYTDTSPYTHTTEAHWTVGDWSGCEPLAISDPDSGSGVTSTTPTVSCGWGLQTRNVSCVLFPSWPRVPTHVSQCSDQPRPSHERLCAIRCGHDCELGPWESWSPCTRDCGTRGVSTRVRRVVVPPSEGGAHCPPRIQRRQCWSGRCAQEVDSPVMMPLKASNSRVSSHVSRHVTLYVGPWSNCSSTLSRSSQVQQTRIITRRDISLVKSFPNLRQSSSGSRVSHVGYVTSQSHVFHSPAPHVGQRTREVLCRGGDGESVGWSHCMDGTRATVVPADRQTCVMARDCVVAEWSTWTRGEHAEYCDTRVSGESRTRQILSLTVGDGKPCPHLTETRPSEHNRECKFRYQWKIGSWSECRVISDTLSTVNTCGGGVMRRNLTCFDVARGRPAHPNLCFEKGDPSTEINLVKRCSVPCTQPCNLSQWSPWSSCQPESCYNDLNSMVKGFQIRTRQMENKGGDESSCGPRDEIRSCRLESCFSWRIRDEVAGCRLTDVHSKCGLGTQDRIIECIRWDGSLANSTEQCSGQAKPRHQVECHVACPHDCIVSPWSSWSRCPPPMCSSNTRSRGHMMRLPLRQRNRTILAMAGAGGQSCPDTDSLMEMGACPELTVSSGCEWYSWQAGQWEECQLAPGYQCGKGLQTRKVYCQDNGGQIVPDWRCAKLQNVHKRRSCEVTCPRNCEVSGWTDWSKCPDMCQAGSSEGGQLLMEIQRRERVVLVTASQGGSACPDTSQVRPCPLLAGSCKQAAWQLGSWTNCSLPAGMSCGEGVRTRSLSCSRAGVQSLPLADCLAGGQPVPGQYQVCHVDCSDNDCQMSGWSAWTQCGHHTCGHTRTRDRTPITDHTCTNTHLDTLQQDTCPCDQYVAKPVGGWSPCILDALDPGNTFGNIATRHVDTCGQGARYRRMECYDSRGHIVDTDLCGGSGYLTEKCYIDCPMDCKLSPWSQWGLCDTICGPGLRNRTSRVIQLPNRQGRPCPGPTVEYDTCDYTCDSFTWQATPWSQCNIGHGNCGLGSRRRSVRCVENIGDGEPAVVLEKFCDSMSRPDTEEECYEPCPGHCVVSPWSDWSQCKQCSWKSRQSRNRTVLRQPDQSSSVCPPLEEARSCVANATCWSYTWHLTDWTSCRPAGDSTCGTGVQTRGQRCVRGDGRPVPRRHCDHLSQTGDTQVSCTVDCPVDCQLSSWSSWSDLQCQCGKAGLGRNLTRSRHIVVSASATGRPCPLSLTQTKPCPSQPCYQWRPSAWSECQLQGAACGTGVMTRNVSCVISNTDKIVSDSYCMTNLSSEHDMMMDDLDTDLKLTTRTCYVSCHHDCTVSEWSQWSDCQHQTCLPQQSVGVRSRTRHVVQSARVPHGKCSPQLKETGWCAAPACYQYQWVVRDGDVFCQRSDGLRVDKGCKSRVVGCGPDCWSIPHTVCSGGQCNCGPGYLPHTGSAGKLSMCLSAVSNSSLQSDQASSGNDAINIHYYPEIGILNYWMFAMITIACIFIVFVGVSIYILCQSTCRTEYRVPDYSLHNGRGGPVVGAAGVVNGNTLNKHVAGGHVHVEHPHHHPQHPLPALWT